MCLDLPAVVAWTLKKNTDLSLLIQQPNIYQRVGYDGGYSERKHHHGDATTIQTNDTNLNKQSIGKVLHVLQTETTHIYALALRTRENEAQTGEA